jgi:UDP-N-acetylmuramyl pentapeptide phosphotransferase/UDP-N-acetylglucosamine-1-phosphate transferase
MLLLVVGFLGSAALALIVVRYAGIEMRVTQDDDTTGPQKFHLRPVPRVGGLAIYVGVALCAAVMLWRDPGLGVPAFALLASAIPAFLAGLAEDLTKNVSPPYRMLATAASAVLASWLLGALIERTAIPGLDWVVSYALGALAVTIFVVVGVTNAVNIIDGFNGLASMCAMLMLVSLAYVGFQVDDRLVALLALSGIGAVLGFFVWNFPGGLIFLGDGGAYFLGFFVAEISILLLQRNPAVSPMFPLLICIYPVFETLFSIYRRRVLRDLSPGMPDGIHLHSLIYRRVMRWAIGSRSSKALTRRNSMTSLYLWMLCMLSVIPAVLFWDNTMVLAACIVFFGFSYVALYWRIVRFKAPRWMVSRR